MIEGSFSQLSAKAVPYAIKIAIAGFLFSCLIGWLFLLRRSRDERLDPAAPARRGRAASAGAGAA
jgi:hypothetical protein